MRICKWADNKIKKMNSLDVGLVKLSAAAFALMAAKLWSPLLTLEWYWYGGCVCAGCSQANV